MSLLGQLMADARKAELGHGIHANCIITAVSNEPRQTKEGKEVPRNAFTTISQRNSEGVIVSEKEISWFNIDPSSEHAYSFWYSQFEQMTGIVDLYQGTVKDRWVEGLNELLADAGVDMDWEADTPEAIVEFEKQMKVALANKKVSAAIVSGMANLYVKILEKKIGEDSTPIRVKLVFDTSGKYVQQPRFGIFTESMEVTESELKMTKTDEENRQKSLVSNKPAPSLNNL